MARVALVGFLGLFASVQLCGGEVIARKTASVPDKYAIWIQPILENRGYNVTLRMYDTATPEYDLIWAAGVSGQRRENTTFFLSPRGFTKLDVAHNIRLIQQDVDDTCPYKDSHWYPSTHLAYSPDDLPAILRDHGGACSSEGLCREKEWVLKRPNHDKGKGITFVHGELEGPKLKTAQMHIKQDGGAVVQELVEDIWLTRGHAFEVRKFYYVSSFSPLVVYAFPGLYIKRSRTQFNATDHRTREVHSNNMSPKEIDEYLAGKGNWPLPVGEAQDRWVADMSEEHAVNMTRFMSKFEQEANQVILFLLENQRANDGGTVVSIDFLPVRGGSLQFLEINKYSGCMMVCLDSNIGENLIDIQFETERRKKLEDDDVSLGLGSNFIGPHLSLIHDASQQPIHSILPSECRLENHLKPRSASQKRRVQ